MNAQPRKSASQANDSRPLALITGASSGIGYELAKVFAENGFDLLIAAENEAIHSVASNFKSAGAVHVEAVQIDLAEAGGVDELVKQLESSGRPLACAAINAGVGVSGRFIETSFEEERRLIDLNIVSLVDLTKRILPDMVARGEGRILFTSSIAATMPGPYLAVYSASKAFVQSFAQAIRHEVKESGVTITALQPGPTDTHFFERAHMLDTKAGASPKDDPAQVAREGFAALMAGRDHVVAGSFSNTLQAGLAKVISEPTAAAMHGKQTEPGSASPSAKGA